MIRAHAAGGFSLIEVLVALVVVTVALGALGMAGARVLDVQRELERRTQALWVADNRIAELRLEQDRLAPGSRSGTARMAGRDWRWRAQVQPAPGEVLWRVDVAVLDEGGEPVLTHTGFLPR
ncbi:MAG: type II secretion system minor pseudopilin GspI [Wenzhouxiangellaceae bacterium]|nr:type II secretion system minor pseudopilin GspI [Wenzhouxiangellaceae bacterium]